MISIYSRISLTVCIVIGIISFIAYHNDMSIRIPYLSTWINTATLILLVLLFNLQADKLINIFIALLIGTPILCMIGTVTSALVLGFNKGSSIISLITLPLYIPVLIFGIEASNSEIILNEISQEFKILIGYLLIVIAVSPWIGGLALRLKYR